MYSKIAMDLLERIENTTSLDDIGELWSEFNNHLGKWSHEEHFDLYRLICDKEKELKNEPEWDPTGFKSKKNPSDYDYANFCSGGDLDEDN